MSDNIATMPPCSNLAAILYGTEDDTQTVLAGMAQRLSTEGYRIGGILQPRLACGPRTPPKAVDLLTGRHIPLCQTLGPGARACHLDPSGLADAAMCLRNAIEAQVDLIIVDKFGKQEAQGGGMRDEIAEAVLAGIPVLAAVAMRVYPAWEEFTGGYGTIMACQPSIAALWWEEMTRWGGLYRASAQRPQA
ncbi:DUF2478 domain-containing protein [Acidocella sp.]|uniref:DUF2478 domain-containing protein n=1 Tax=Acidocella sp. TaxID=50710 RepID=UPI003D0119B2